jgi:hypothetical protein
MKDRGDEMIYEPITILSAELPDFDFHTNFARTSELRNKLLEMGLNFVGISTIVEKQKSQSFIVTTSKYSELLKLAKEFGQKSILVSDGNRNTIKLFTNGDQALPLGKLYLSSKDDALQQNLYMTFYEDGKQFYFITKEGEQNVAAN